MEIFDVTNGRSTSVTDTLYSQIQRVYFKCRRGEEKSMNLRINIELKSGLTISTEKVLSVLITDDNDCCFYYSLLLTQEDFRVLKSQQGLLVDFSHFPTQLVKLIEVCRSQELSKFILVLDEEESDVNHYGMTNNPGLNTSVIFFKVIETNNFKNLCHLSLKLIQGSDADIKRHMSTKIKYLTDKILEKEKQCNIMENNLGEALQALEEKTKELNSMQVKLTEEKSSLKIETSHQLAEEREKFNKLQMEWQNKIESEKSKIEGQFTKIINDLNEQINLLTFNNKNLYEAKCQFELAVKEKTFQVETLEKQISQYSQEIGMIRKQNSQLEQEYHEKEKHLVSLKTKLAVAEQEIKDKSKLLDKQQELWRVANVQKAFLEETLTDRDNHLQRKQIAIQNMSSDLMKSNEIISKLQTDLAASKAKMKLRTDIALEQERILEKKTQQLESQTETIHQLEGKVEQLTKELNSVRDELQDAKKAIQEKEIVIKKNDNVINWLNRRLTESTNSSHSLPSGRSENESISNPGQHKSNLSQFKGWAPWLMNSISTSNPLNPPRKDSGQTTSCPVPHTSSTPLETATEQPKSRLPKGDENEKPDSKKAESRTGGLDPKYFQTCMDMEGPSKAQVLKAKNGKTSSTSSTSDSRGRPPISAYFPRKPAQLQSNQ